MDDVTDCLDVNDDIKNTLPAMNSNMIFRKPLFTSEYSNHLEATARSLQVGFMGHKVENNLQLSLHGGLGGIKKKIDGTVGMVGGASPEEKRVDPTDGNVYTRKGFIDHYEGTVEWESAVPAMGASGGQAVTPQVYCLLITINSFCNQRYIQSLV